MLAKELLDLLVCPYDKTKVVVSGDCLKCSKCSKTFPIKEGIPVFV